VVRDYHISQRRVCVLIGVDPKTVTREHCGRADQRDRDCDNRMIAARQLCRKMRIT